MRDATQDNKRTRDDKLPDSILETVVGGVKGGNQDPPPK